MTRWNKKREGVQEGSEDGKKKSIKKINEKGKPRETYQENKYRFKQK